MSNQTLKEKNKKIRERILSISNIKFVKFPVDSPWLRPIRMNFIQDSKVNNYDLMRVHNSVTIVIFNVSRKKLVLVKQFRPGAYSVHLPERIKEIDVKKYPPTLGLTLELCSGIVDKDKSLVEIAQDELLEECGYEAPISAFEKIITYSRLDPSSGRETLFYVEVTDEMNTHAGGGLHSEGELIEIIEMSIEEIRNYINSEEVQSPAGFLHGISWFLANKSNQYV